MRYHTTEARRLLEVTRAGLSGNGIEIDGLGETRDGKIILRGGLTLTAHSASQLPINMGGRGPASVGPVSERTVHFMQQANLASPAGFKSQLPSPRSVGFKPQLPSDNLAGFKPQPASAPRGHHSELFTQSTAHAAPDSSSRLDGSSQTSRGESTADSRPFTTSSALAGFDEADGDSMPNVNAAAEESDDDHQDAASLGHGPGSLLSNPASRTISGVATAEP